MTITLRNSLGLRLLRVVFSCYLIVTVAVTAVQLYVEYGNIEKSLLAEMYNVGRSFEDSIATGIWSYDTDTIESILSGVAKIKIVAGVVIKNLEGEVHGSIGDFPTEDTAILSTRKIEFSDREALEISMERDGKEQFFYEYTFDSIYVDGGDSNPEIIGKVYIYSSRDTVINRVANSFTLIIVNAVIKTLALWIIFLYAAHKMIARPLAVLTRATRDLDRSNQNNSHVEETLKEISNSKHKDELHLLANSFLKMKFSITEKINNLNTLNNFAIVLTQSKSKVDVFESVTHLVQDKFGCNQANALNPSETICWSAEVEEGNMPTAPTHFHHYDLNTVRGGKAITYKHSEGNEEHNLEDFFKDPSCSSFLYLPFSNIEGKTEEMWFFGDIDTTLLDDNLNLSHESLGFLKVLSNIASDTLNNLHQREVIKEQNQMLEHRVAVRTKELELLNEELKHLSVHDPLTGLPNRVLFQDRLDHLIHVAVRENKHFAVANIDLTKFKLINDTYGHDAGDVVLKEVATRFSSCLRKSDTLARMGGDEFAAILIGEGSNKLIEVVVKRLNESLKEAIPIDKETSILAGANIGITFFPEHATEGELLYKYSDIAMYHAKRSGEGFAIFNPEKNREERDYLQFMYELENVIELNQLKLHYQPVVNLKTGLPVSFEALLRWEHPVEGMVSPAKFIPHAEKSGFIMQLTEWVVEMASKQCMAWRKSGFETVISINLSPRTFTSPTLPQRLEELVRKNNAEPCYLKLEITESTAMNDLDKSIDMINELGELGFSISIDDFGTGHSSLSYLTRLPLDELKIDRSFVLAEDENSQLVIQTIIELAHALGFFVVAEGVENEEKLNMLIGRGCDAAQGFHICRPSEVEIINAWLAKTHGDGTTS